MIELGMIKELKKKNDEKARLMKTIKIPMNLSQINNELPQKKYEKEKMLLNDEYETAKKTFYHPPTIHYENENNNNYNEIDNTNDKKGINNNENNNNNYLNNIDNIDKDKKNLLNKELEDKFFVEKLLEKDLNNIQNIIKNIDNINLKNNHHLNNDQKALKNIDNNSININSKINNVIITNNKPIEIGEPNTIKNTPKINIDNHNKYSNINYDYILNEQENINRIIKTDMNQINPNLNNININTPYIKKEEIIKTEMSNINTNFKNNENKSIQNLEKEKKEKIISENDLNNNKNQNNYNIQENDFKDKYYKLMEEIRLKDEKKNR
jgi:hypothetical protein